MKTLFGILLLLFVAASAALLAVRDPGYVLIERVPFVLETSLAVFVLLLAAAFTLFYYGTRLVARILRAPRDLARWRQVRRARRAREAFHDGLALLLAGEWLKAEKALVASLHAADAPYLGYLAAAIAAHGQRQPDKRDEYLAHAAEQAPEDALSVDLTRARLQLAADHPEEALATLVRVRATHPAQAETARLLIQAYRRLHDWQGLAQLLPEARRRAWLPEAELDAVEIEARRELLCLNLPAGALDTLKRAWDETPKPLQKRPEVIAAYARQLLSQQAPDECAAFIAATLEQHWSEELARLYGLCVTARPAAQLEVAEEWLARHGESPALLLTLARLARHSRFSDRARGYLERSLALATSAEAEEELARLYEDGGDSAQALAHYRRALALSREPAVTPARANRPAPAVRRSDYGY